MGNEQPDTWIDKLVNGADAAAKDLLRTAGAVVVETTTSVANGVAAGAKAIANASKGKDGGGGKRRK